MTDVATKPVRIQRRRTRGWRLPEHTRCVTRPGPFGNPFTGPMAISIYRWWLENDPDGKAIAERARRELRGLNLACFCKPGPCHADVLLEVANAE